MKLTIIGIISIISGFTKLGEIISEAIYIKDSLYAAHWIYLANISLMILPYIIVFFFLLFWGCCSVKNQTDLLGHVILSFYILTHPLGLGNIIVGYYMLTIIPPKNKSNLTEQERAQKENLRTLNFLSKSCVFIECILQSLPQTALKSYNNYLRHKWELIGIITIGFSVFSALLSMIQVISTLDKETKSILKKQSKSEIISATRIGPEVYDNTFQVISYKD